MGFKRTPEGRIFFQGTESANDEIGQKSQNNQSSQNKTSNPAPQMRSPLTGEKTQGQIITLLKTLNERLKVTQADRDRMMKELEEHRTIIEDLEDKAERNERRAFDLQDQLEKEAKKAEKADKADQSSTQAAIAELEKTREALIELERKQSEHNKALTDKVTKGASGIKALQRRVESTEAKQTIIDERIESAMGEQAKLIRKVDKAIEDRARFMRKIERIEETVIQTRDSLNAKAMVLLTEKGVGAHTEIDATINDDVTQYYSGDVPDDLPDDLEEQINEAARQSQRIADIQTPQTQKRPANNVLPWWNNTSVTGAIVATFACILAVLVIGILALNDWKLPYVRYSDNTPQDVSEILAQSYYSQTPNQAPEQIPEVRAQEREELPLVQAAQNIDRLDWKIEQKEPAAQPLEAQTPLPQNQVKQVPPQNVNDNFSNDVDNDIGAVDIDNVEEVAKLIETEPQRVAAALNNIEPQKQAPIVNTQPEIITPEIITSAEPQAQQPVSNTAPPQRAQAITKAKTPIDARRDTALPNNIRNIEDQAFEGNGEAQHDLAAIYTAGHGGVKQDYKRAAYWFERAAENGIANASYNLGVLYHQGLGFDTNINKAMSWYKDAAGKDHPEAQYNLGIAYIEGIGVPYDPVTASRYFENAANSGIIEAAYNLGLIYENGLLGQAEPQKALLWYKTASDQGSPEASQALQDLAKTLQISTDEVNSMVDQIRQQSVQNVSSPKQEAASIESTQDAMLQLSTDQGIIAQIQEYLMRAGLYPGPADGVNGALTQDAIRSYQSMHNIDVSGEPTQSLLKHMLANSVESLAQSQTR